MDYTTVPRTRRKISIALFLVPALLVLSSVPAAPCGMSTHGEVCARAAHYFSSPLYPEYEQVVRAHPEAYQAGSSFPDWGYSFDYPEASEEAHWPPFLEATARYLRDRCPRPWDEEDERRIAFFLGVISHDIADIDWHGLDGVREGFIDVMSRQEFHGGWGAAHDAADSGGDFVEIYQGDMNWLAPRWYYPLQDMAAIYQELGYEDVSAEVLLPRAFVLFAGAVANRIGGRLLYPQAARKSTFLAEAFQDYFPGGLDSMALRTVDWWEGYIRLMEEERAPGASFMFVDRPAERVHGLPGSAVPDPDLFMLQEDWPEVRVESTEKGIFFYADSRPAADAETGDGKHLPGGHAPGHGLRIFTDTPYSYLGRSLVSGDLDGDGLADLVIGAPGYGGPGRPQAGAVFVLNGRRMKDETLLNVSEAEQLLEGPDERGRFGWALALVDLNADGHPDLAVSSPAAQAADLQFHGKVRVYFGSGGEPLFSSSPDLVIDGGTTYTRLGWSLGAGDVNRDGAPDLLVGSPYAGGRADPQRGLAAVYLADSSLRRGTAWTLDHAAWRWDGEADYDWFGYRVGFSLRNGDEALVLVGAPGADTGAVQAAGRLYAYRPADRDPTQPVFTVTGDGEFDKTGLDFTVAGFPGDGREILALAAPTRSTELVEQAGAVFLLDMKDLHGDLALKDLSALAVLAGNKEFGRMGWRLATGDLNRDGTPDLLVTQPWMSPLLSPMTGAAALWMGGAGLPRGPRLPFQADARFSGEAEQARLGDAAGLADFNGDGHDDIVLAASRDSRHARFGGTLTIYLTPPCEDRDGDGYGDPGGVSCLLSAADCDDDPADDPAVCSACTCGTFACAGCARCIHPGAREFPLDPHDSNCDGQQDCFIARAAFGTDLAGKIEVLRDFRDRCLLTHGPGIALVNAYYRYGPALADALQESNAGKRAVRFLLLPLIGFASLCL